MAPSVRIGDRLVGAGGSCVVAVEIGLNHNGSLELAHRHVDAAADAGADAVKFQYYRTEDFIGDRSLVYEYAVGGETVVEPQYDMFKRYELPEDAWPELRDHCRDRGVMFFATPTNETALERLVELGVPMLKNGSDYLGHAPLVRAMARTGLPTVLSTGMAEIAEVAAAVEIYREAGGRRLVLLHCTSSYPTPPKDVHLRKMDTLAARFDCPVGFSDHSYGPLAAVAAAARGACMLEKHFTIDRSLPGPDHRFSSDPEELRALVDQVRTVERMLGRDVVEPAESELVGRRDYRVSCVASRPLDAGSVLSTGDIAIRRPGTGLPPGELETLVGRRLIRALDAGTPITAADVT